MRTGNIGGIYGYVGLRQRRAISPLLLIAVVEVISSKVSTRDILHKLIYADDRALVADSETNLQDRLVEWKEIFGRHGLRVSLEKTKMLRVRKKKDLNIRLDGKNETALYIWVERFVGTAARRRKFAGVYKLGRVHGGKWNG